AHLKLLSCPPASAFGSARLAPVGARAHPEFRAEGAVEVRQVPEPALQGEVQHLPRLRGQAHRGLAQAGAKDVLMWRHARDPLEGAEEVIRAEARLPRQVAEGEGVIRM